MQSNSDSNLASNQASARSGTATNRFEPRRLSTQAHRWWQENGPLPPLHAVLVMYGIDPSSVAHDAVDSLPADVFEDFSLARRHIESGELPATPISSGSRRVYVGTFLGWFARNTCNRLHFEAIHETDAGGWLCLLPAPGSPSRPTQAAEWPAHDTPALRELRAAAQLWRTVDEGGNYDPDDISTAPTNASVEIWLDRRGVRSRRMREAIASILRPDDLRTGPRGRQVERP